MKNSNNQAVSTEAEALVAGLPPLLTQDQAAIFFQVTTRTVRRWNRLGRLPSFKTTHSGSGRVLISRVAVARLLDQMRVRVAFEPR